MSHNPNEKEQLPHIHSPHNNIPIDSIPSAATIQTVSETLKQLCDPSRLKIFWVLCHYEECVINIAMVTGMSSPAVSHHLRILKASGLIVSRRDGKERYYKVADTEIVKSLHNAIESIANITCPL